MGTYVARFEEILLVENKQWVAEFDKPVAVPDAQSGGTDK
jgi:hypothetical protein